MIMKHGKSSLILFSSQHSSIVINHDVKSGNIEKDLLIKRRTIKRFECKPNRKEMKRRLVKKIHDAKNDGRNRKMLICSK